MSLDTYINKKGINQMNKELKILQTENRIALLSGKNKDNNRIVKKLKRQLRNLRKAD